MTVDVKPFSIVEDHTSKLDVVDNIAQTAISPSLIHGYGLFSTAMIPAGKAGNARWADCRL